MARAFLLRGALALGSMVLAAACCSDPPVYVGSAPARFDHNRSARGAVEWVYRDRSSREEVKLSFGAPNDSIYSPYGHHSWPRTSEVEPDGLRAGVLAPQYPGVWLPLRTAPVGKQARSDYDDLVLFLNHGTEVLAGIDDEIPPQDLDAATRYGAVLTLLKGEAEPLDVSGVRAWADQSSAEVSGVILDARYPQQAWDLAVGVRFEDHWFVLYKYQGQSVFHRLVVVPATDLRQDMDRKTPEEGS